MSKLMTTSSRQTSPIQSFTPFPMKLVASHLLENDSQRYDGHCHKHNPIIKRALK